MPRDKEEKFTPKCIFNSIWACSPDPSLHQLLEKIEPNRNASFYLAFGARCALLEAVVSFLDTSSHDVLRGLCSITYERRYCAYNF